VREDLIIEDIIGLALMVVAQVEVRGIIDGVVMASSMACRVGALLASHRFGSGSEGTEVLAREREHVTL
jgi:hypothetical protein